MRRPWIIAITCLVVGFAAGFGACYVWSLPVDRFELKTVERRYTLSSGTGRTDTTLHKINTRTGETWTLNGNSWVKTY